MLSPLQDKLYWRQWGKVCRSRNWRMVSGRLDASRPEAALPEERQIWDLAETLAEQAVRAVSLDEVRHACHLVAAGHDGGSCALSRIPHHRLTNRQFDRLLALFRLLVDDADLDAAVSFDSPQEGERRRIVARIKTAAPFQYIDAICRDKFAGRYTSPFYEDLPFPDLRALFLTLSARTNRFSRPIPAPAAAGLEAHPDGNQPF